MILTVAAREVHETLSTIESKLTEIHELTRDGFNAEQEVKELQEYVSKERKSVEIPTINRRDPARKVAITKS